MKTVVEEKIGKESEFFVTETFNNVVIREYSIRMQSHIMNIDGVIRYLLYNSKIEVISDAYLFLNKNYKILSPNTKHQYFYVLKYMYSFLEIIEKDIQDLLLRDFYQLGAFLRGVSAQGSDYRYVLLTKRSTKSVRQFFSVYCEYLKYLGLFKSPLLRDKGFQKFVPARNIVGPVLKKSTVPRYIKNDDYKRIMAALSDENDIIQLRSKCIIRLMYEGGLRIGEVLGLTFEDYELRRPTEDKLHGKQYLILTIRNRLTDKKFQQAKTCCSVMDKRSYLCNDYNTLNVGYEEALVFDFDGDCTYDCIANYEKFAHDEALEKYPQKYKSTIADKVGQSIKASGENRYLFLNNHGGVLSDAVWNLEFRKLLSGLNIPVDIGFRKQGLNHKFRHGFVMKLLYEKKLPLSQIKGFTRHRNDMSLNPYNNPTIEDLIRLKEDIVDKIISQEPTLDDWVI